MATQSLAMPSEPTREAVAALEARLAGARSVGLAPPPELTVSEWADAERVLSSESSAEPGRWSTDRAPYLRAPMDACSDPEVPAVWLCFGSQLGKTEVLGNLIGYHIDQEPAPILAVFPTERIARTWSKDRLAPMLRDTPALQGRVEEARSRKSGSEILEKKFPGGILAITGSNAPSGLAMRPVRIVAGDEVDRWALSAGTEGDPIELARKRTSNFWNRFEFWSSSPGEKGRSRIWKGLEGSTFERWFVPCVRCELFQVIRWEGVRWDKGADGHSDPSSARYVCESCSAEWDDADRVAAVCAGEWRAKHPGRPSRGFHLPGLASPWVQLSEIVEEWTKAQGDREQLKVFINTRLAELWEEPGATIDPDALPARRERYTPDALPTGVLVVTAGVDVQDDRLEVSLWGYGARGESWLVAHSVVYGAPDALLSGEDTRLDELVLESKVRREDGVELRVAATCVDSGGHFTDDVYRYAKRRRGRRVYAIKGRAGEGVPLWPPRATTSVRKGAGRASLYVIGVDTGKRAFYHRLKVERDADGAARPGFVHFPEAPEVDEEFFAQLCGETERPKWHRGRLRLEYEQTHPNVEALDCRIYADAAVTSLNPNFEKLEKALARRAAELAEPDDRPGPDDQDDADRPTDSDPVERMERDRPSRPRRPRGRRRGGFVSRY